MNAADKKRKANQQGNINRLPDEILLEIINKVSEAKSLFNLSFVSKRFASLIPHHSAGTVTLRLPNGHSRHNYSSSQFIDSFGNFLKQLRCIRTLHLTNTHKNHNLHFFVEFRPEKSPLILVLAAITSCFPPKEEHGEYCHDLPHYTTFNACVKWENPLRTLLFDHDDTMAEEEGTRVVLKNGYIHCRWYAPELKFPEFGCVMKKVMLRVTTPASGGDDDDDDGVFFLNTTGKDAVLLEAVQEMMKLKPYFRKRFRRCNCSEIICP